MLSLVGSKTSVLHPSEVSVPKTPGSRDATSGVAMNPSTYWSDRRLEQLEEEGRAPPIRERDGHVVRLVDLQVGMTDGQRPAEAAKSLDLVLIQGARSGVR